MGRVPAGHQVIKESVMKSVLFVILLSLSVAVATWAEKSVKSGEAAIERVLELTGLGEVLDLKASATAESVSYKDSTIPFIPDTAFRRSWRVGLEQVPLVWEKDTVLMRAEVYVDSSSGALLRVILRPYRETHLVREPTSEEATKQMVGEQIHGFLYETPQYSLASALKKCKFYPLHSDEVIIWYVEYSWKNGDISTLEPTPAWVIYMRGTLPVSDREWIPLYKRNHRRYVFNAIDGSPMCWASNIPYPELNDGE